MRAALALAAASSRTAPRLRDDQDADAADRRRVRRRRSLDGELRLRRRLRIDPRTNAVTARIRTGRGPIGVAYGAGSVWVANWSEDTMSRVDPDRPRPRADQRHGTTARRAWPSAAGSSGCRTNPAASPASTLPRIARRADPGRPGAGYLTVASGSVWVTSYDGAAVDRIDPRSNRVVGRPRSSPGRKGSSRRPARVGRRLPRPDASGDRSSYGEGRPPVALGDGRKGWPLTAARSGSPATSTAR